jgi:hypothetical protein
MKKELVAENQIHIYNCPDQILLESFQIEEEEIAHRRLLEYEQFGLEVQMVKPSVVVMLLHSLTHQNSEEKHKQLMELDKELKKEIGFHH